MKEKYITAEMEIVEFECEDVITTSTIDPAPEGDELPILK